MKERGILMSGPMVRAILDGRKTKTRRVVTPAPIRLTDIPGDDEAAWSWNEKVETVESGFRDRMNTLCPYGQPGDRLWVRETWGMSFADVSSDRPHVVGGTWGSPARPGRKPCVVFRADGDDVPDESPNETARWSPSIHMPRWASRLSLEITEVRVERVQEITPADCEAEGLTKRGYWWDVGANWEGDGMADDPVEAYRALWDSLNKSRGFGWDANPFVWVIAFRVLESRGSHG